MDGLIATWDALIKEPMALLMAAVAVMLAIVAISFGVGLRNRLFALALAVISGVTAWMMASRWRWPIN